MSDDPERSFGEWVQLTAGISPTLLFDIEEKDTDWALVIKLHAIVEAGLNQLIRSRLSDPKLADIISNLSTNDARRGKLAFVKAYDLLPATAILLVKFLSDVRNTAVHDVEHFNLNLLKYIERLKPEDVGNWKTALGWWWPTAPPDVLEKMIKSPRRALWFACIQVLARAFRSQAPPEFYQRLLDEQLRGPETPNPTEP